MSQDFDEYVQTNYDKVVVDAGEDGMKLAAARDEVEKLAEVAIKDGLLDRPGLSSAIAECIASLDTRRRQALPDAIQFAAAALNDETILGPDDPALQQAFSVGGGMRKALRFCGVVDLDEMVSARRQNMAQIVAAFDTFAADIDQLKATMRSRNARIVLDLCKVEEPSANLAEGKAAS